MVSRSEDASDSGQQHDDNYAIKLGRRRHRDDVEFNELDISLRISYKTLVLCFVLFDISHRIVSTVSESALFHDIFG